MPFTIRWAINKFRVFKWLCIIKPIVDSIVFLLIQLHINGFQWLNIEYILAIVKRRLLIVERRKSHPFEMSSIPLLPSHHNPHCSPLSRIDWFNDSGNLINESYRTCYVVKYFYIFYLLPRHWNVLEQFVYCVRRILQGA